MLEANYQLFVTLLHKDLAYFFLGPHFSSMSSCPPTAARKRPKVEYNMLNELEHILARPDTQVGSTDLKMLPTALVFDPVDNAFAQRDDLEICPALGKLVDELLVNVADHKTRNPDDVKRCKVTINPGSGELCVWNDGPGIDVEIHPDWNMYKPQGIFGHLRSSSNYNDDEERLTGGRNGHGAKLCNIFATKFTVETCDGVKKYKQTWTGNMSKVSKPSIRTMTSKNPKTFTCISFIPDWTRFGDGIDGWSPDMILWIATRCAELAGTKPKLDVMFQTLPDKPVKMAVKGFRSFTKAIAAALVPDASLAFCDVNERWAVGLMPSLGSTGQAVSFVNSVATPNGGTHVRHVRNQLVKAIRADLKKRFPSLRTSDGMIEPHLLLTLNCLVPNPTFGSQTKEELTLPATKFGVRCAFKPAQLAKLLRDSDIVQVIADRSKGTKYEESAFGDETKKTRTVRIPKLEDAVWAGGAKSDQCTLILTEGDSAKALAVAGLAVVGRKQYGVFPLRGKPLNVRQASAGKIRGNLEIQNVIKIVGLRQNVDYRLAKHRATLRYGSLLIMADQDDDGTHIKSLVVNFIAVFNRTLLAIPFLNQFVTPVLRARKGKKLVRSFYSTPEYDKWAKTVDASTWTIKYYKGLGTSSASEAREYFRDLERHRIPFDPVDIDQPFVSLMTKYAPAKPIRGKRRSSGGGGGGSKEVEKEAVETLDPATWNGLQWLEMAFEKDLADLRKAWLVKTPVPTGDVPISELGNYAQFFSAAYRLYCQASIVRAIPSVFDGLKPSQRKILYMAFTRKNTEIKVEAFAGHGQGRVNYHHGAVSLMGAMIGMAQNFPGSNNVNLLQPVGQFGTRLKGGKDHAAARYIFTKLDPVARALFPAADDPVLRYRHEEGMDIEPFYYIPVIPMSLVNGSSGMGTGWSTNIPGFDPLALINVIEHRLKAGAWDLDQLHKLHPYVRGFEGSCVPCVSDDARELVASTMTGMIRLADPKTLVITELPPGKWTTSYLAFAERNVVCKGGKPPADVRTLGTESKVHIQIVLSKETVTHYATLNASLSPEAFESKLVADWGLEVKVDMRSTTAYLLNETGQVQSYTVASILDTHATARFALYKARKQAILNNLTETMRDQDLKARFVQCLLDGTLVVRQRSLDVIRKDMTTHHFPVEDHETLLSLPLKVQTKESVAEWQAKLVQLKESIARITATTPTQFWQEDLKVLRRAIRKQNEDRVKSITN